MGAPDLLEHLRAAGVKVARSGGNLIATPKAAVTPEVLQLLREHKAELLDELAKTAAELIALVYRVADYNAFTPLQRAEAVEIALADHVAALECFRKLAADIPVPAISDDRIRCTACANLRGRKCAQAEALGAGRSYEPVQDVARRCESFKPLAGASDQRPGSERWPDLNGKEE